MASNVLRLHLKQTFPPKIWIFTEGEVDGFEPRLPFKIFSTLYLLLKGNEVITYTLFKCNNFAFWLLLQVLTDE